MWFCKPGRLKDEEETWERAKIRRENRMRNKELALATLEWETEINKSYSPRASGVGKEQAEGKSAIVTIQDEKINETKEEIPETSKGQNVAN